MEEEVDKCERADCMYDDDDGEDVYVCVCLYVCCAIVCSVLLCVHWPMNECYLRLTIRYITANVNEHRVEGIITSCVELIFRSFFSLVAAVVVVVVGRRYVSVFCVYTSFLRYFFFGFCFHFISFELKEEERERQRGIVEWNMIASMFWRLSLSLCFVRKWFVNRATHSCDWIYWKRWGERCQLDFIYSSMRDNISFPKLILCLSSNDQ